jgi:hypothetical protein
MSAITKEKTPQMKNSFQSMLSTGFIITVLIKLKTLLSRIDSLITIFIMKRTMRDL